MEGEGDGTLDEFLCSEESFQVEELVDGQTNKRQDGQH